MYYLNKQTSIDISNLFGKDIMKFAKLHVFLFVGCQGKRGMRHAYTD
jgi:hypothetical protein